MSHHSRLLIITQRSSLFLPGSCSSSPWCWWRGPGTCPSGCGGGIRPSRPRPRSPPRGTSWRRSGRQRPALRGAGRSSPSQLSWHLAHPQGAEHSVERGWSSLTCHNYPLMSHSLDTHTGDGDWWQGLLVSVITTWGWLRSCLWSDQVQQPACEVGKVVWMCPWCWHSLQTVMFWLLAQLSALTTIRSWPRPGPGHCHSRHRAFAAPRPVWHRPESGEFRESETERGDQAPQDRANTAAGLHSPVCLSRRQGGPTRTSPLTRPLCPVTPLAGVSPGPGPTLCPDHCPRMAWPGSPNSLQSYISDHYGITRHWSFLCLDISIWKVNTLSPGLCCCWLCLLYLLSALWSAQPRPSLGWLP